MPMAVNVRTGVFVGNKQITDIARAEAEHSVQRGLTALGNAVKKRRAQG